MMPENTAGEKFQSRRFADDEAASGAPERFAFGNAADIAQAFGHDAAVCGRKNFAVGRSGFDFLACLLRLNEMLAISEIKLA